MATTVKRNSASSQKIPGAPRSRPKLSNNPKGSLGNVSGKPVSRSRDKPQGMR